MSFEYPELQEQSIKRVVVFASRPGGVGAQYLSESPYSASMRALILKMVGPDLLSRERTESTERVDVGAAGIEIDELLQDILTLKKDLESYGQNPSVLDGKDANTYFRLMGSLVDKLLTYKERALNLKSMGKFTEAVLQVIEDKIPIDERNKVMDSLKKIIQ